MKNRRHTRPRTTQRKRDVVDTGKQQAGETIDNSVVQEVSGNPKELEQLTPAHDDDTHDDPKIDRR